MLFLLSPLASGRAYGMKIINRSYKIAEGRINCVEEFLLIIVKPVLLDGHNVNYFKHILYSKEVCVEMFDIEGCKS